MSAVPPRVERDAGAIPRAAATGPSGEPAVVASRVVALDAALDAALDVALATARERYRQRCPGSLAAHRAASDWMPGGNTRTVLYHGPFPLRFATGQGAVITDVDGHRHLNLLGEYTAGLFGHSHPVIRQAIDRALSVRPACRPPVSLAGRSTVWLAG